MIGVAAMHARMRRLWEWFLPSSCALCGASVRPPLDFCDGCERSLPASAACCARCAAELPADSGADMICGECQQHPPGYTSVHAAWRYAPPIDRLIQGAKYGGRLDWVDVLGRRLAHRIAVRARSVDAVIAVPLHPSRLRERGYNQSLELARLLAKRLSLPLRQDLRRTRATPPQTKLSRHDRRKNVRDAFAVDGTMTGLRLAVVDDVLTSGATADAVTRCLHKAGAKSVEIWIVARA